MPALTDAMQKIIENGDGTFSIIFNQPASVTTAFVLFFVGVEAIAGIVFALMLFPVNVEKTVGRKQAVIRARQKAACEARGEIWIEPEVRAAQEQREQDAAAEEIYREELKARCQKNHLDYDAQLAAHIEKLRLKEEKLQQKQLIAEQKAEKKAELAKKKREAKLASLTPEQRASKEAKERSAAEKDEAKWRREEEKGERTYLAMQAALEKESARAQ